VKTIEKILVLILIVLLITPAIQKETSFIKVRDLEGDFILAVKPAFSWNSWFDGSFQVSFDRFLEDHIGFRNFLIRLINQIDFSLFRLPHGEGVIAGKNGQLFEYDYIRAFTGEDFIGESNIDKRIRMFKYVQEYLQKEKNIHLILVFEPGKASVFPECIPDRYLPEKPAPANYDLFVQKAGDYGLKYIDFNKWFKLLKGNTDYPVYPHYGTHWSEYGMSLAADSLLNFIEITGNINLPEIYTDSIQVEKHARKPDYDIGNTMNLLWRLPYTGQLAYPVYRFEENPEKHKPMVLVVGDSYYWNIFNTRIPRYLFKNEVFWYFNSKVYPDSYHKPKTVKELNIVKEVEKMEFVFLMVTERFLHTFDWTFADSLYSAYGPVSAFDKIYRYKAKIWNYGDWMNSIISKAKERNISVEEMLETEAKHMYFKDDLNGYITFYGISHFKNIIRNNPEWYKATEKKAENKKISIDEMLTLEADYVFKTSYAGLYKIHHRIDSVKQTIRNNNELFDQLKAEARSKYLTEEEMLQIKAEEVTR
jgi:hypothetical protein